MDTIEHPSRPADAIPLPAERLLAAMAGFPGPQILDVRRDAAFAASTTSLPGALRRDPDAIGSWIATLEPQRPVVAVCVGGHAVSQAVASALARSGLAATYLAGGIAGWESLGFPLSSKPGPAPVFVTRERPKIDRIACPWFIRRFIAADARFVYAPAPEVARIAEEIGGTAFDIPGAPYTHVGEGCSFDAFVERHRPDDQALRILADIVRGADTEKPALHAAATGLLALSLGLSALAGEGDALALRHGMVMYDALYLWARDCQAEQHRWPPRMVRA
ncbi:chromate resistance protein ChrB domain-containing protein [Elioraea rosea]|uniref:chromate resistance protein ChrB domain-containing protein n=1 Tax=Elioraea rosea TaxID=2492390 RepID=UPI0011820C43|nr:chromate resistance protein ChrB domain-containing protein [Elioraea rosea]